MDILQPFEVRKEDTGHQWLLQGRIHDLFIQIVAHTYMFLKWLDPSHKEHLLLCEPQLLLLVVRFEIHQQIYFAKASESTLSVDSH